MKYFLLSAALAIASTHGLAQETKTIRLSGPPVTVEFAQSSNRLALVQIQHGDGLPLLFVDEQARQPGASDGPLAVIIRDGKFASTNTMANFHIVKLDNTERRLRAYLEHDSMPLLIAMDISVEGSVIEWVGQALWNGDEKIEAEILFPLLSRVKFDSPQRDRAVFPPNLGVGSRAARRGELHGETCVAQPFDGPPRVVTVGNTNNAAVKAMITLPVDAGVLLAVQLPVLEMQTPIQKIKNGRCRKTPKALPMAEPDGALGL